MLYRTGQFIPLDADYYHQTSGPKWVKDMQVVHHSGSIYTIVNFANEKADADHKAEFPFTVVYKDNEGNVWARDFDTFITKFKPWRYPTPKCERHPDKEAAHLQVTEVDSFGYELAPRCADCYTQSRGGRKRLVN